MAIKTEVIFNSDNIILVKFTSPFLIHFIVYTPWGYETFKDYNLALLFFNERLEELR
ncbi:hypothetical protein [Acholeplasma hippikon]|nr:hypothetical protein [Acholeplasma hippikon]